MSDALTGLPNHRRLAALIEDLDSHPRKNDDRVGLILGGLDHFLKLNDFYGHAYGDQVLLDVARRIAAVAPGGSTLARISGDEFALLLPVVNDFAEVQHVALAVLRAFDLPVIVNRITFSLRHFEGDVNSKGRDKAKDLVMQASPKGSTLDQTGENYFVLRLPPGLNEKEVQEVSQSVFSWPDLFNDVAPLTGATDVRLSLGVSLAQGRARTVVRTAANALYEAKRRGRSRAVCLDPQWMVE